MVQCPWTVDQFIGAQKQKCFLSVFKKISSRGYLTVFMETWEETHIHWPHYLPSVWFRMRIVYTHYMPLWVPMSYYTTNCITRYKLSWELYQVKLDIKREKEHLTIRKRCCDCSSTCLDCMRHLGAGLHTVILV